MSHFTVIVIGKNPEQQLAPYDENIEAAPYVSENAEIDPDTGELETTTYNPKSKWDWYQLGGRWRGYFKLKHPNQAGRIGKAGVFDNPATFDTDQARKGDIDFDGMRKADSDSARKRYELFERVCGGTIPKLEQTWAQVLALDKEKTPEGGEADTDKTISIDDKRDIYGNQAAIVAVKEAVKKAETSKDYSAAELETIKYLGSPFGYDLEDFQVSKDDYVSAAARSAISSYALVKDGEWYQKGEMGWWGMSSDEMSQADWDKKFTEMIDALPDDTLISLYDCHI